MGYSRRTSNCPKRITLSDLSHVMSMADLMATDIGTPRIDSGCFLEKEFVELIHMNNLMVLYQTII